MSATLLVAAGRAWGATRPDGQDDCHPSRVVVYDVNRGPCGDIGLLKLVDFDKGQRLPRMAGEGRERALAIG